jgi:hypothetical protein
MPCPLIKYSCWATTNDLERVGMVNQFGWRLAEAMFDVGIGCYSELLEYLWYARADPQEANITALVNALEYTEMDARPHFSPAFWRVLFSPQVLDLSEDESKELMFAYAASEAEIQLVLQQRSG